MKRFGTIEAYITSFPPAVRRKLESLRGEIRRLVPDAQETFSYGIPTFKLNGNLVHYAGYETHIGFYPTSSPIKVFAKELSRYDTSKGTIRLPLDKPLPLSLIRKIVKFRIAESQSKPRRAEPRAKRARTKRAR